MMLSIPFGCARLAMVVSVAFAHSIDGPARATGLSVTAPACAADSVARAVIIGSARIVLDSSFNFESMQDLWGPAPVLRPANRDDTWKLCYQVRGAAGRAYVLFETNEIGGPDHTIFGARLLTKLPRGLRAKSCRRATAHATRIETSNGLRLGLSRDRVAAIMGAPKARSAQTETYEFYKSITTKAADPAHYRPSEGYEIIADCEVQYRRNRVTGLRVWYLEMS